MPDQEVITSFLKTFIADKVPETAKHFNSWEHLFACTSLEMKTMGVSVVNRKLILAARERVRQLAARQPDMQAWVATQKQAKFEKDVLTAK